MLRLQNHSNYNYYLNTVEDALCIFKSALCTFKILQEQHQQERCILLADSQFGAFYCCSSDIMEVPSVALCALKMCWESLMHIQNMAEAAIFIMLAPRVTQPAFMM
jgi:hypothetical protein